MKPNEASELNLKERILTSALELFSSQGYAGTRIQDIAEKAQVYPADIYRFYAGKQALFDALQHPEFDFPDLVEKTKREMILRQALKLFSQNGYANTSMDEIATSLKLTKPAVYYYYPSKEALFRAILEQPIGFVVLQPIFEQLNSNTSLTFESGLERIAEAYLGLFFDLEFTYLMKMVLSEGMHDDSIAEIFYEKVVRRGTVSLSAYFQQFLKLDSEPLNFAAQTFVQSLFGWGLTHVLMCPHTPASEEQMTEASRRLVKQFLHGIQGIENSDREMKEVR